MSGHGSSPEEEAPQSSTPSAPALHAAFSSLKKEVIGAHTGLRNYERGLEYWRAGRVRDRRAEGETISARCTGNSPEGILEAVQIQVTRLPACKDEMRKAGLT